MAHRLEALSNSNGGWQLLVESWRAQCAKHGEDFESYAAGGIPVLEGLASSTDSSYTVYGLKNDETGEFDGVCSVNWTHIPGYQDKVLRVRNLLFAPEFDFGDYEVSDYALVLTRIFARTVGLALTTKLSRHIKFHLRSPVERQFFALAGAQLDTLDEFKAVKVRGAWLYVDLA